MAKFSNGDNNGASTRKSELERIIKERRDNEYGMRSIAFRQRVICNHKPENGLQKEIELLANAGGGGKGIIGYDPKYTVKCVGDDGCGDVFNMKVYTDDELNLALYTLYSAAQQMKIMDGGDVELDEVSRDELYNIIAMFQSLSSMIRTYRKMMKNNNKKNQQKMKSGGRVKGGIGMPNSTGRMY